MYEYIWVWIQIVLLFTNQMTGHSLATFMSIHECNYEFHKTIFAIFMSVFLMFVFFSQYERKYIHNTHECIHRCFTLISCLFPDSFIHMYIHFHKDLSTICTIIHPHSRFDYSLESNGFNHSLKLFVSSKVATKPFPNSW